MVKLSDTEGKSRDKIVGGAYARCFEDLGLSQLLSRVQSLIIKNGYELAKIITDSVTDLLIVDLDKFLSAQTMGQGVRVAVKKVIRKSKLQGNSPDFIVFERIESTQNCYILELKDGHEFDTRSSAKERADLRTFLSKNAMALKPFQGCCKICGFNAKTKEAVQSGFKNKIKLSEAMTGKELCDLLNLDYEQILEERSGDSSINFNQFIDDLVEIGSVRAALRNKI